MKIEEIKKQIQNIKLTPEEKREIFNRVVTVPIPSPYTPVPSPWRLAHKPIMLAVLSLFVLLAGGSGMSYASLRSIPGDSLYSIKTKVAEPVVGALKFKATSRAEWEAKKAIRRLDEAEKLSVEGKLTVEKRTEIEKEFNKSVEGFNANVEKIKIEKEDDAEKLEESFQESLSIRAENLDKSEDDDDDKEEVKEASILSNEVLKRISPELKIEIEKRKEHRKAERKERKEKERKQRLDDANEEVKIDTKVINIEEADNIIVPPDPTLNQI